MLEPARVFAVPTCARYAVSLQPKPGLNASLWDLKLTSTCCPSRQPMKRGIKDFGYDNPSAPAANAWRAVSQNTTKYY
jgi:hypothetical protein